MNLPLWRFNYANNHKQQTPFNLCAYIGTTVRYLLKYIQIAWWLSWILVVMCSLQSVCTLVLYLATINIDRNKPNKTRYFCIRCENDAGWQCTYWNRARWKRGKHNKSQFTHHQIHHQYAFSAKIDFVFIAEHSATFVLYYTTQ